MDNLSYALGLSMGGNFIASGIKQINVDDFADGLRAVFEGAEKKMSLASETNRHRVLYRNGEGFGNRQ